MTVTCKTCKHLDVPPDKAGRRVVRSNFTYRCKFPLPPLPVVPLWVENQLRVFKHWPPSIAPRVEGSMAGCQTHEPIKKGNK